MSPLAAPPQFASSKSLLNSRSPVTLCAAHPTTFQPLTGKLCKLVEN